MKRGAAKKYFLLGVSVLTAALLFLLFGVLALERRLDRALETLEARRSLLVQARATQEKLESLKSRISNAENHLGYLEADSLARLQWCREERWRDANQEEE